MKRLRHAILVQLVDGPLGAEQEKAIRSLAKSGSSLSSVLRSLLLREAGRFDLDVPVVARVPAVCDHFVAAVMRPEVCSTCARARFDHPTVRAPGS